VLWEGSSAVGRVFFLTFHFSIWYLGFWEVDSIFDRGLAWALVLALNRLALIQI
jgi:hypothetical protein